MSNRHDTNSNSAAHLFLAKIAIAHLLRSSGAHAGPHDAATIARHQQREPIQLLNRAITRKHARRRQEVLQQTRL